jgi:hypothetical protein
VPRLKYIADMDSGTPFINERLRIWDFYIFFPAFWTTCQGGAPLILWRDFFFSMLQEFYPVWQFWAESGWEWFRMWKALHWSEGHFSDREIWEHYKDNHFFPSIKKDLVYFPCCSRETETPE